jgi:hypothetical protein
LKIIGVGKLRQLSSKQFSLATELDCLLALNSIAAEGKTIFAPVFFAEILGLTFGRKPSASLFAISEF